MKRGLLALCIVLIVVNVVVVFVREQPHAQQPRTSPLAAFDEAIRRHDYRAAYALTDLGAIRVVGGSSAITVAHFAAFERAHPQRDVTLEQGVVHVPTTDLRIAAPTGPLPSLAVDGVTVPLRAARLRAKSAAAAYVYNYAIVVISGPHTLSVGSGPVTAARSLSELWQGTAASSVVPLALSSSGERRAVAALDAITGTCPDHLCLVAPCGGHGGEYVLDAWGIGTPPIVGRALVGGGVVAPMPPNGWSIAVTFLDQGQPPGLSGRELTAQLRARFVFGFVAGANAMLLDRCWVSHR